MEIAVLEVEEVQEETTPSSLYSFLKRRQCEVLTFLAWLLVCLPANLVTLYLYLSTGEEEEGKQVGNSSSSPPTDDILQCHELKEDWEDAVAWSKYLVQGICVAIIGIFGMGANILSIIVLFRCKENENFHLLLACMAIVDLVLVAILVTEISIIGVFLEAEPQWFVVAYPKIIHPIRGIIQTLAILMVVAVSFDRYRAVVYPMSDNVSYIKYVCAMVFLSTTLEISRFFEFRLNDNYNEYWTTDLSENPFYVRFNSYWNEIFATGLVPLILLCYLNFKTFRKIKASSSYRLRFVANTRRPPDVVPPDPVVVNTFQHSSSLTSTNDSASRCIQKKQEKSTTILIAIILVFIVCQFHRLAFRIYELALPENLVFDHYLHCEDQGKYHVPVAIYFLSQTHYFFLVINSSVNFIIYCARGQQFRKELKKMFHCS